MKQDDSMVIPLLAEVNLTFAVTYWGDTGRDWNAHMCVYSSSGKSLVSFTFHPSRSGRLNVKRHLLQGSYTIPELRSALVRDADLIADAIRSILQRDGVFKGDISKI